jgi:putative NAD(P)H nitroreductase
MGSPKEHKIDFQDLLERRTAVDSFASAGSISRQTIEELVHAACQSPSSFNLQNWRFVAVFNRNIKEQLQSATMPTNRARLTEASVIILFMGDLKAHEQLSTILQRSVQAGLLLQGVADVWLSAASQMYGADQSLVRDEAIRSCSLAAMTFMLAAAERGYATCPIGFNQSTVREIMGFGDHCIPVIMLALGHPPQHQRPRRPRLSVADVLTFRE